MRILLLAFLAVNMASCITPRKHETPNNDAFASDNAVPVYRAESPAILYVTRRIRDGDVLIGSHYVFVRPDAGDFETDDSNTRLLLRASTTPTEIAPSKADREKLLSIKMTGGFLKRQGRTLHPDSRDPR